MLLQCKFCLIFTQLKNNIAHMTVLLTFILSCNCNSLNQLRKRCRICAVVHQPKFNSYSLPSSSSSFGQDWYNRRHLILYMSPRFHLNWLLSEEQFENWRKSLVWSEMWCLKAVLTVCLTRVLSSGTWLSLPECLTDFSPQGIALLVLNFLVPEDANFPSLASPAYPFVIYFIMTAFSRTFIFNRGSVFSCVKTTL